MNENDDLICVCAEVYRSTIEQAIRDKQLTTAHEVGIVTGAGTHCGGCIEEIEEIIRTLSTPK